MDRRGCSLSKETRLTRSKSRRNTWKVVAARFEASEIGQVVGLEVTRSATGIEAFLSVDFWAAKVKI